MKLQMYGLAPNLQRLGPNETSFQLYPQEEWDQGVYMLDFGL